jgi:hypothetical protein
MWHVLLTLILWFAIVALGVLLLAGATVGILYFLMSKIQRPGRSAVHAPPTEQYVSTVEASAIAHLRAERYSERSIAAIIQVARNNPEMLRALAPRDPGAERDRSGAEAYLPVARPGGGALGMRNPGAELYAERARGSLADELAPWTDLANGSGQGDFLSADSPYVSQQGVFANMRPANWMAKFRAVLSRTPEKPRWLGPGSARNDLD